MEKKVNFVILGVFMMGLFLSAIVIILWLNNYSSDEKYKYFKVNTKDSVSGISIKAPVKYRGVAIGEVEDIFINPNNSEEVSIKIKVKYSSPIKEDTYAVIEPQGITGLSYIQLEGGSNSSPLLKTSKENLGIIQAKASFFTQINTTLRVIGEKSEKLLDNANRVLSEKNIKNIEHILDNTAKISSSLEKLTAKLEKHSKNFEKIIKNANKVEMATISAAKRVSAMSNTISNAVETTGVSTMVKMSVAADSLRSTMDKIGKKMDDGLFDVQSAAREITVPLNQSLQRLDAALTETESLVEQLKHSPSDILYKHSNQKLGPGEKR